MSLRDLVAVRRAAAECMKDQQVERALEQRWRVGFAHSSSPLTSRRRSRTGLPSTIVKGNQRARAAAGAAGHSVEAPGTAPNQTIWYPTVTVLKSPPDRVVAPTL